ncbi:MAG: hypothetical protein J6I49_00425 [Bacteroidales bacterium]|nr:hypothetical protein [Bacteroidales bacterium]
MKKKRLLLPALLCLSILPLSLFANCDKDTNCYLEVKVFDSDKKTPLSNTPIKIHQTTGNLIYLETRTNGSGTFNTRFSAPAIVIVDATTQFYVEGVADSVGYRQGQTSVSLVEGETVTATVFIKDSVIYYGG